MRTSPSPNCYLSLSKLKLFLALSRTQHGLLDMATPALCALLWLGEFPSATVCLLGLITTFAGYTAVYALNDVVDYRVDKARLQQDRSADKGCLDDALVRHPMASGLIDLKEGMIWVAAWAIVAVLGAYVLNPVCVLIFLGGCVLEIIYCRMLQISYLRTLISGAVKTTGSIAAVFAVDPHPSFFLLSVLFLWLFFWEIGGQNVALDWIDVEEDRRLNADTIPVRFGTRRAKFVILSAILASFAMGAVLFSWLLKTPKLLPFLACLLVGFYLLIMPAVTLYRTGERTSAVTLFNRASYYPPVLLLITATHILI